MKEDEKVLLFAIKLIVPVVAAFAIALSMDVRHILDTVQHMYGA